MCVFTHRKFLHFSFCKQTMLSISWKLDHTQVRYVCEKTRVYNSVELLIPLLSHGILSFHSWCCLFLIITILFLNVKASCINLMMHCRQWTDTSMNLVTQ